MNAQNTLLATVMDYQGSNIAFENINGKLMINATQMAKPFKQKPQYWLKTQQAKDLVETLSVWNKVDTVNLVFIKQGGLNQGTWLDEELALVFAQWLSPDFYLACNRKLKELLTQQTLQVPAKHGVIPIVYKAQPVYCYIDCLRVLGASTKSSTFKRKKKNPEHFFKVYGRNFITGAYFDLLKGYYDYKKFLLSSQLTIDL